jgi:hypothetical protein
MIAVRHVGGALLLTLLLGCGGPQTQAEKEAEKRDAAREDPVVQALHKTGQAYTGHMDEHQKGPASWEELISYAQSRGYDVAAIEQIKAKGYRFKWGMSYRNATDGVTTFVLAQPSGAGPKLMLDGSIQVD